jgi:adenine-specific DNA-methyltransferase
LKLQLLNPAKKLKASYQRLHIDREKIELFKENIKIAFDNIAIADKKKESEEHYKAIVRDFLLDTYYKGNHSINTQGRNDLVIHNGSNATSPVGIIIETKQPTNKAEMISAKNPNSKSFQQLITYFLKERFENKNLEIKHLIISNIYEWYIFDASDFERYFYDNKKIKDSYLDWTNKTSLMSKTDWFYQEVLFPHIEENLESIPCTYFNLNDYKEIINNDSIDDDEALLDLYKILSPVHLLKKQVANDSNSLNKQFYAELLHILGLEEIKEGSKKTIKRCAKPNEGSILENTLAKLKTKARDLSETEIYDTALELTITWLNRILFLKLLEGQLIKYNFNLGADANQYAFLNYKKIDEYDILEELFFEVLAVNYKDRPDSIQKLYANIPYLNSSLFEETELERKYFGIGLLKDRLDIPIFSNTVLDFQVKGSSKRTLEYLFEFLDAYDFSDDTKGKIKEQSKTIINASVLGLIFEKINGYKDGSFFTPSFITMYMCRESIRRAVVQKFNETYNWKCEEFIDLKNEIKSIKKLEASEVLNTLRICDPAVGSGHFLVSALNEMISIKQDLKILIDKTGEDFSEYSIEIENDELIIKDEKGNPTSYNVSNKESRRIQETLFNEKQTIIENCLFGVDINPKSVMICRLRLWIELLKNAYYTESSKYKELETLPNIDINIKCGNSLISRFEVKDSVFETIPNFQNKLKDYSYWVSEYKNIKDKGAKTKLAEQIQDFKNGFKLRDPRLVKIDKDIAKVVDEIDYKFPKNNIFGNQDPTAEQSKIKDVLLAKLEKITAERKEIESNKIYDHAFEWRFEFPEVLDENGKFIGFDVVIGNPPYIKEDVNKSAFDGIRNLRCYQARMDLWYMFGFLGLNILKPNNYLSFIATNNWVTNAGASNFRNIILDKSKIIELIDFGAYMIFDTASIQTMIMNFQKVENTIPEYTINYSRLENDDSDTINVYDLLNKSENKNITYLTPLVSFKNLYDKTFNFYSDTNSAILEKINHKKNFILRDKEDKILKLESEFGNGIDVMQDFVSKSNINKLEKGINVGDGVFILSQKELDDLKLNKKEQELIKPYYTSKQLSRYYGNPKNTHWIIYTKSDIGKFDKKTKKILIDNYPILKSHLDKFQSIITSAFAPYGLNRAREQYLFEGSKILAQRKCPKMPIFTFVDFDSYVSRAQIVIKTNRICLLYLTGLLNSKLIEFWLRNKGKMQGNAYQIDKEPILDIPIFNPENKLDSANISKLVSKILSLKKQNPESDTSSLESEIDKMVYELYGLSDEEVRVVEGKN